MRIFRLALAILFVACSERCVALSGAPAMKRLLIIGAAKGYRHEAVSHAAATIERLGRESGLWSTTIRTDTEALTKKKLEYNAKNLNDFDAPIVVEDANFPGMQQWPKEFVLKDEIYQMKDWTRENVRVLMRLDSEKIDLKNPQVHRKDRDFGVAWVKMYGKGRVYYSTLGHVEQNWDDPRLQQMYVGAIKWAIGLVDADVTPRALPGQTAGARN